MRRLALVVVMFAAAAAHAQFRGEITVVRIVVDARVTDYYGNPVPGLTPSDFIVKIGGRRVVVESVEWVDESSSSMDDASNRRLDDSPGRLFVVFVQTDHARESFRLRGQINFIRQAEKMIAALPPEDRLAVFQFDSHLKFRLDFTSDKNAVRAALRDTIRTNIPPPPEAGEPALTPHLDRAAMRRAGDSETALFLVGDALRHLPGPKSMLLLGWGLGMRSGSGAVHMRWNYPAAARALEQSRTTVFALDVAWADAHDLAVGLKQLAADTGGYYASTFRFPQLAIQRLQKTLRGHYELVLQRPPELALGTHRLEVDVPHRGIYILAPKIYMDRR